ncbi:MAG TPA: GNVR domain-containing protein [Deltaproteobacteria bacterium]|nr:GNVR domain-containing protein [Deltaproteobacteria bacterium]
MERPSDAPVDYVAILKRRKWALIVPLGLIFIVSVVVAFVLPPVYKATTTILIEQQDVPLDYVKSAVSTYAEQQLQIINQRIMSTTRLMEIINRLNLYPELKSRMMTEEIIERMREDIALEPISVDVVDPKTGRPTTVTIAFTISYEGKNDPGKVLQVGNVLTSLFLEENSQVRERQVTEVSNFLQDEVAKVKGDLERLDGAIAQFKQLHMNNLPELVQVNMQSINDTERNIDLLNNQLTQLREKEGYLLTQLSNTPQDLMQTDRQRLSELNVRLVNLKHQFSDAHPDVIKTRSEIAELEKRVDASTSKGNPRPDNPAYINLAAQLASTRSEMASVNAQIESLRNRLNDYKRRIELSPQVEAEYNALLMERNSTQLKYDDLMRKYMESKVSQGLEKEQKGERFTIIDPARMPEKPYKPNRLAIMLIGLVLGIGAGIGTASFKEYVDSSVRNTSMLTEYTSFPVLANIPTIVLESDVAKKRDLMTRIVIGLLASLVFGVLMFHFFIMDLDMVWVKLVRWMGI